jgi:hypothetical protein
MPWIGQQGRADGRPAKKQVRVAVDRVDSMCGRGKHCYAAYTKAKDMPMEGHVSYFWGDSAEEAEEKALAYAARTLRGHSFEEVSREEYDRMVGEERAAAPRRR